MRRKVPVEDVATCYRDRGTTIDHVLVEEDDRESEVKVKESNKGMSDHKRLEVTLSVRTRSKGSGRKKKTTFITEDEVEMQEFAARADEIIGRSRWKENGIERNYKVLTEGIIRAAKETLRERTSGGKRKRQKEERGAGKESGRSGTEGPGNERTGEDKQRRLREYTMGGDGTAVGVDDEKGGGGTNTGPHGSSNRRKRTNGERGHEKGKERLRRTWGRNTVDQNTKNTGTNTRKKVRKYCGSKNQKKAMIKKWAKKWEMERQAERGRKLREEGKHIQAEIWREMCAGETWRMEAAGKEQRWAMIMARAGKMRYGAEGQCKGCGKPRGSGEAHSITECEETQTEIKEKRWLRNSTKRNPEDGNTGAMRRKYG
jgi:hypothetical protein